MLRADNLAVGHNGQTVLTGVNLAISPGDRWVVMGANGSGKSTLLHTLCGALAPISGGVRLDGRPISAWGTREVAKRVAYVSQAIRPGFDFSVRDVVLLGRLPYSRGLRESKTDVAAAERAMEEMDCLYLAERSLSTLSGGERQRVWLARALAQEPTILLLDEPTSHLDLVHQRDFLRHLLRLSGRGIGIVAASHDLEWATAFGKSILVVAAGKVAYEGATDGLRDADRLARLFGVPFTKLTGPQSEDRWVPSWE